MKTKALTLALCLAITPTFSQNNEPRFTSALEAGCAGVIIGIAAGTVIIIVYRCITKPKELVQSPSSRPSWVTPPEFPPMTNTPPATNVVKMLIAPGPALTMYDLSSLQVQDRNGGCQFTNGFLSSIEYSQDGQAWSPLFNLYGWISGAGRLVVVTDADWNPLATNYVFGTTNRLDVPLVMGDKGFFRMVAP